LLLFFIDSNFCAPQFLLIARRFIAFIVAAGAAASLGLHAGVVGADKNNGISPQPGWGESESCRAARLYGNPAPIAICTDVHDLGGADSKSGEA